MEPELPQTLDLPPMQPEQPKKSKKKYIIGIFIVLAVVIALLAYFFIFKKHAEAPQQQNDTTQNAQADENPSRVRLIATGDMIPHDAINEAAKQADGSYSYASMFGDMKTLFDKANVRFCNQATLAGGAKYGVTGYPVFNAPTEFTHGMADLGCNVINTGSNHVNDQKQEVISSSVEAWNGLPGVLAVAGANASASDLQKVHYFDVKGVKFAFVSYTTYTNSPSPNGYSVTMYSKELATQQLAEARSKADVVMVSMRWGTEYSPNVNATQKTLAREVANLGADVVLGHGPHVLEPAEKITLDDGRDSYIWYSLGNFLNAQLEIETLFNGIAVMDIDTSTKKISSLEYLPVYMHYEWTAEDKAAGDLLARKNFSMYTFEDGQEALDKSQNDTTFEAQRQRIQDTLNTLTEVKLITKDEYLQS